ncbi:hypothetical protein RHSIM_Rhsim11G0186100 [Rhododendron simsii]|uniref:Uncharacterized protein n=1 Tax=Rhododendron simsii TaxID=118357 RepID=A0A834G673_RHOSS|nr:hypothetical protein RHSIM_Rhsim11G0186100 [Rhododendron simsii]
MQHRKRSTPALKGLEKRGEEVWRRKGVPESSNQGGVGRLRNQEGEYSVRVEEEDTFRTVPSTNLVSNSEVNSENEKEDDEVDRVDDVLDASKTMKQNSVDDMEKQGNEISDDRAKINEEEAERVETNCVNGSHQAGLEKEPVHEESPAQRKSGGGKHIENSASCENSIEESLVHGLDSIVQDSQSPLAEECVESVQNNFQGLNAEPNLGDNQDQEKGVNEANNSGTYGSDVSLRASQLPEINLHIELNPSAARRNIRSQQLEASVSTDGDDIDGYIMGFQEQEQDAVEKELQNTMLAGNTLGIKFGNSGILRMKKMIENESIAMKASIKNNPFAPLLRD